MKSIPLLLLPIVAVLVSACAVPGGPVYGGGYGPGPDPREGYYWNGSVYVQGDSPYRHHDDQYSQRNVNDVDVNRTNINDRTVNDTTVNRTNVNDRTVNQTDVNRTDINRTNANKMAVNKKTAHKPGRKTEDTEHGTQQGPPQ